MKVRVNGHWFECKFSYSATGVGGVSVGELSDVVYLREPRFHIGEVSAVARDAHRTGGAWLSMPDPDCSFGNRSTRRIQADIIIDAHDDGGGFYLSTDVPDGIRQKCLQILQEMKDAEYV